VSVLVRRSDLVAALKRAKGVTAGSGEHPMLKQVLMAAEERPDGFRLTISATNLHESVSVEVEAEGGSGDVFQGLVGPDRLIAFLAADPGKEVELVGGATRLTVKGLAKATFPLEEPFDYPELPAVEEGCVRVELTMEMAAAVRRAARFTVEDPKIPMRENVFLWEEGRQMSVGASEGHALWFEESLGEVPEGWWMPVPRGVAASIETCSLVAGQAHLFFLSPGEVFSVRRPEIDSGSFIRDVAGRCKDEEEKGTVVVDHLLPALGAVAARIERYDLLSWAGTDGETVFHAQGATGEAEAVVPRVELPEYRTKYAGLLVAGLKALAEVAGEDEEAALSTWQTGILFRLADGKATLILTSWKG
jgi:hypothetical protein